MTLPEPKHHSDVDHDTTEKKWSDSTFLNDFKSKCSMQGDKQISQQDKNLEKKTRCID
jgi:hypothetical protein